MCISLQELHQHRYVPLFLFRIQVYPYISMALTSLMEYLLMESQWYSSSVIFNRPIFIYLFVVARVDSMTP